MLNNTMFVFSDISLVQDKIEIIDKYNNEREFQLKWEFFLAI